ncbi:MAG: regulatory protein RecX [Anaerolineales bacterium]
MAAVVQGLRRAKSGRPRVEVVFVGGRVVKIAARAAEGLRVGQHLTEADLAEVGRRDEVENAHQRALGLLARRPRSEGELRQAMRRRNVADGVQAEVLERLRSAGWVDDSAFAAAWVENRDSFRPRSAVGLRAELRRKGVGRDEIEAALHEHDEAGAARAVLERAARRWKTQSWEEFRLRGRAFLARQGFSYDTVSRVVRDVWSGTPREESEASS